MLFDDLRARGHDLRIATDLCLVGSGPAGLTVARELANTGIRILVLESGGLDLDASVEALSEIENVGAPRVIPQTLVRNRVFGGSSCSWSGRCAAFSAIDFEARDWIPYSGWPIARNSLQPYLLRAANHLGLNPLRFDDDVLVRPGRSRVHASIDSRILETVSWQLSRDDTGGSEVMRLGQSFSRLGAPNIRVLLHASAVHITTDETGTLLREIEVANPEGNRATITAKLLVLCAGGIENARLLLASNRAVPAGLGNEHDLVGRFLMDHPRCIVGEFNPASAVAVRQPYARRYTMPDDGYENNFIDGLAISPVYQRRVGLLNCAAWLDAQRAEDDPWTAAARLAAGNYHGAGRGILSIVSQPRFMMRGAHTRLARGRGVSHKLDRLAFQCDVEQEPHPNSRLRLSGRRDRLGLPIAELDWRIGEKEKIAVATIGHHIHSEFKRCGLPVPLLAEWIRTGHMDEAVFTDVAHPTGTTRMATDPRHGVVDENCRIHGMESVFIAGSSVFPTAGRANPTLMIVALAIRLADHLKQEFYSSRDHGALRPLRHEPDSSRPAAASGTLVLSAPASAIVRSGKSGKQLKLVPRYRAATRFAQGNVWRCSTRTTAPSAAPGVTQPRDHQAIDHCEPEPTMEQNDHPAMPTEAHSSCRR